MKVIDAINRLRERQKLRGQWFEDNESGECPEDWQSYYRRFDEDVESIVSPEPEILLGIQDSIERRNWSDLYTWLCAGHVRPSQEYYPVLVSALLKRDETFPYDLILDLLEDLIDVESHKVRNAQLIEVLEKFIFDFGKNSKVLSMCVTVCGLIAYLEREDLLWSFLDRKLVSIDLAVDIGDFLGIDSTDIVYVYEPDI